jgi:retinol dehydrogenase 12
MACRDLRKGHKALEEVKEKSENDNVHLIELDLASVKSIVKCSREFPEKSLHILVNNAGIMACPKSYTKDGFEMQIGTNHLGHFLLTILLLDKIKSAAPSRIINVSSTGHKMSDLNREDLMSEKSYSKIKAYAQSKLANILFTQELSRRLNGTGVTVNSCHPGIVQTELGRHMVKIAWIRPIYKKLCAPFFKTPFEGAQTQIKLALDPDLVKVTGKYYSDCEEDITSDAARNADNARWLWNESVRVLNEKLDDEIKIKIKKFIS